MACCLHRVGMEQDTCLMRNPADLGYRHYRPDLVVCSHYRNENSLIGNSGLDIGRIYHAIAVNRKICYRKALLLKPPGGVKHCMMLNL